MRASVNPKLESFRRIHPMLGESPPGGDFGYFEIPVVDGIVRVISSGAGDAWEHVSVSHPKRCPTWEEMSRIKDLFWGDHETVIQFHPKK